MSSQGWKKIITQKITVDRERCIGCGACLSNCPFMVYELKKTGKGKRIAEPVDLENCFLCQSCQVQCPTDAIRIDW